MKKIFFFLLIVLVLSPFFVFAQAKTYTPLVNDLPGITGTGPVNLTSYLGALYKILIGLTIALAFVVITFEGLKHMGSESPFAKSEASRRIGEAIGGIILAVMSWLILFTINPDLVSFKFLQTAGNAANNILPQISSQSFTGLKTKVGQSCFDYVYVVNGVAETKILIECKPTAANCKNSLESTKLLTSDFQVKSGCYLVTQ